MLRLHQEDFCQALGFLTYMKYQPSDSNISYLSTTSSLLNFASLNPVFERTELAKKDILSIALDLDISLDNFDQCVREILDGILSLDELHRSESSSFSLKILNNSKNRIKVLEKYLKL